MNKPVVLFGYQFSVYNRIVRMALHEKGVEYQTEEINPFASDVPKDYLDRHPFHRVPVLIHGEFDVYETAAIIRYIDAAFKGPSLMPVDAKALCRVTQVVSIIDNYGYVPMIRQVFAHRVFRRALGEECDEKEISTGMKASLPVLEALNALALEGYVLDGRVFTLADCYLSPMVAYFIQAPEGAAALRGNPALNYWWQSICHRKSITTTESGLPSDEKRD